MTTITEVVRYLERRLSEEWSHVHAPTEVRRSSVSWDALPCNCISCNRRRNRIAVLEEIKRELEAP